MAAMVIAAAYTSLTILTVPRASLASGRSSEDKVTVARYSTQIKQFADPPSSILQQLHWAETTIPSCRGKKIFLRILLMSEDYVGHLELSKELCDKIPTMEEVEHMYGPGPVILGLETCHQYQRILGGDNRPKPRVAGLYHTATNALARSFQTNIEYIGTVLGRDGYNVPVSVFVAALLQPLLLLH
jgi:hypothetical protein